MLNNRNLPDRSIIVEKRHCQALQDSILFLVSIFYTNRLFSLPTGNGKALHNDKTCRIHSRGDRDSILYEEVLWEGSITLEQGDSVSGPVSLFVPANTPVDSYTVIVGAITAGELNGHDYVEVEVVP